MTNDDILRIRLNNQHLLSSKFQTPAEAVSWLGAVQSQDFSAAKWALGQRVKNATDASIEKAYNDGAILRTHVMRPTWHFVHPADIRWMLKLTAPRVKKFLGHYNRKLELDDALFKKTNKAIVNSLKNHTYLTRQELKKVTNDLGIKTDVQRLAHIVMWAELDGLICSGPKRDKQLTYALLEECAPKTGKLIRDESMAKLALTYFSSHGPAQLIDFSWWSGLNKHDAQAGLDFIKSKLTSETFENKTYWFTDKNRKEKLTDQAYLLSIYDEYTIAYKDRSNIGEEKYADKLLSMGNALTAVLILGGKIAGTWKRMVNKKSVVITISPLRKFSTDEKKKVEDAATGYASFLELPLVLQ